MDASEDGGVSWKRLAAIAPYHSGDGRPQIVFSDKLDGYVVLPPTSTAATSTSANTDHARLYVTHDAGHSWAASLVPGPVQRIVTGLADDWSLTGTCDPQGTCQQALAATSDKGRTWTRRSGLSPMSAPLLVRDGQDGWIYASAIGATTTLLATVDGGYHWSPRPSPCPTTANAGLAATHNSHLWLVCGGEPGAGQQPKSVFRSADGGLHWQLMASSGLGSQRPIGNIGGGGYVGVLAAASDQQAWLGLDRGTLISTVDGGTTWTSQPSFPPPEDFFAEVQFINRETGWAAIEITSDSAGNGIYRTIDGGRTWTHSSLP